MLSGSEQTRKPSPSGLSFATDKSGKIFTAEGRAYTTVRLHRPENRVSIRLERLVLRENRGGEDLNLRPPAPNVEPPTLLCPHCHGGRRTPSGQDASQSR